MAKNCHNIYKGPIGFWSEEQEGWFIASMPSSGTAYTLWLHVVRSCPGPTAPAQGFTCSDELISHVIVLGYHCDVEVCATLSGYVSPASSLTQPQFCDAGLTGHSFTLSTTSNIHVLARGHPCLTCKYCKYSVVQIFEYVV